jgi:hypothetical protein
MEDNMDVQNQAAQEDEGPTVQLCGACGYVLADCVTHPGVHPIVLRNAHRTVPRKSEEHVRALSTFHSQRAHWEKRIKAGKN